MDASARTRAEDLRRWRSEYSDARAIDALTPRYRAVVVGVVHKIRLVPGRGLEATIEDGSGQLTASWTGRSALPGVELGTGLRLSGTVARERDGSLRMRNPEYALVAEPYR
ncbi:MAG: hypothetical protein GEU81_07260 [Nitriliruptorales bacterium]|nr:hypothetical protein [Nitriliruptorales bacterium]